MNIIKLLIVDDEFYFRQYLKTCINWEALGCRIVGEASDGEEGLALLKEKEPDVILLDINMPCIDGIAFSQKIFQDKTDVKIIILSGHSEFQYAQKAMKYGVKSYLLKPLDEEELCQTLNRIREEIEEQKSYRDKLKNLEKKQQPFIEAQMVNELAHGRLPQGQKAGDEPEKFYLILAVEADGNVWKHWSREEMDLWICAIKNVCREIIPESITVYFGKDEQRRFLCLLESEESFDNNKKRGKFWATKLTDFVSFYFPFQITAGIGSNAQGMAEIQNSYNQAVFSLKNRFVSKEERVMEYEKARSSVSENSLMNSENRSRILMYLRQGDYEREKTLLMEIFRAGRLKNISYDMLRCHCTEFIFLCLEYLEEKEIQLEKVLPELASPLQILDKIHTLEQAEKEILELYQRIFEYTEAHRNTQSLRQLEEIKEYIHKHYRRQDFKITDIANAFHLNYHYLCHSFKQQTGMTLNQYITWFRIEQAKRRMEQGVCNLTLLAEEVGYSDLGYFGKCFKKQTGISPSRYLEKTDGGKNKQNYQ